MPTGFGVAASRRRAPCGRPGTGRYEACPDGMLPPPLSREAGRAWLILATAAHLYFFTTCNAGSQREIWLRLG